MSFDDDFFGFPESKSLVGVHDTTYIIRIMNKVDTFDYSIHKHLKDEDSSIYVLIESFFQMITISSKSIYTYEEVSYCGEYDVYTFLDKLFKRPLKAITDIIDYMIQRNYIKKDEGLWTIQFTKSDYWKQ